MHFSVLRLEKICKSASETRTESAKGPPYLTPQTSSLLGRACSKTFLITYSFAHCSLDLKIGSPPPLLPRTSSRLSFWRAAGSRSSSGSWTSWPIETEQSMMKILVVKPFLSAERGAILEVGAAAVGEFGETWVGGPESTTSRTRRSRSRTKGSLHVRTTLHSPTRHSQAMF